MGGCAAAYVIAPNFHPDEPAYVAHALEACRAAGVGRVGYHSVASPYVPAMAHHLGKAEAEHLVRRSGLAWTILQPGVYLQNFDLTRPVEVPYDVHATFGFLDLADLGEAAATVLLEDGHVGATYELASRTAASPSSPPRPARRPPGSTRATCRTACGRCSPTTTRTACPRAPCPCGRCSDDRRVRACSPSSPAGPAASAPRPPTAWPPTATTWCSGYASDDDAAESTARAVREHGPDVNLVRADLTTDAGVDLLFGRAAELGTVTGLVNNAGATLSIGPLAEASTDVVRRTVDLNLTAAILCARAAVRLMSTSRGGSGGVVVNVSSGAATLGAPHEYVQYAAAKAGLDALTTGLAIEVAGEGIRVVGVAPGIVRTTIHADAGEPGRVDRVGPLVPLGRVGEPAEVADAIGWLMSDQASYVTGTTLRVAGGR